MDNPLVFIHGAGDSARAWREQAAFFGTRAYAIDLPGHGERPDSLPEEVSVADYARAVRDIIREELRLEKPVMVGHSLGGLIALEMGLTFGAELGALVLIGSGARMRVLPALMEAARTEPAKALFSLQQMSVAPQNDPGLPAQLLNGQTRPESDMLYRDLVACNNFDVMGRLHELHLPTLVLCGAEERNAPVKYSEYLHAHLVGSTLKIIPNAGHYVQREKPAEVNRALAEWLVEN